MRRLFLGTFVMVWLVQGTLSAQAPPTNPGAGQGTAAGQPAATPQAPAMTPEQQKVLDDVLATWETDAKGLQSLYVQFLISTKDAVFVNAPEEKNWGEAKVLRLPTGAYGLRLDIYAVDASGKPDPTKLQRRYVCTGNWIYTYDLTAKTIHAQQVLNLNVKPDDGPFAFVFGMKATEAKDRFTMNVAKQDVDWTWIQVRAKLAQDLKDFTVANVGVINRAYPNAPKFFPLMIQWKESNNNIQTWHFQSVIRNDPSKVNVLDFSIEEDKKRGWQLRIVPNEGALRQPNQPPGPVVPTGANVPRK